MVYFFIFCALAPQGMYSIIFGRERGGDRRSWLILSFWYQNTEKRNNALSQMRLRSVFKMRMSILNTATTEQIGYSILSFFVYTKSTNQVLKFSSFYHNTDSDCKYYQWNHKYCHNQCCFLVKCRYDCILCF